MAKSTRTPLMAGNWKMNLNHQEALVLVQKLAVTPGPGAPHRLYHRLDYTVKWRPGTPPLAHRGSFAGAPRLAR